MNTLNKLQKICYSDAVMRVAIIFVMSVGLVFLSCPSGAPVFAGEYDFSSLTPGNLNGQDNWQTTPQNTIVDIQVGNYGNDGTQAIRFNQSGAGVQAWALRENNGSFSLPSFTGDHYVMEFDIRPACWGTLFGIGADTNSDGLLAGTGENGVVMSINTGCGGTNRNMLLSDGTSVSGSATLGTWNRIRVYTDLLANSGQGSASVYFKNLTAGDTSWTQVTGLQNVNLQLDATRAASDSTNPHNWNAMMARIVGTTGIFDNISISMDSPGNALDFNGAGNYVNIGNVPGLSFSGTLPYTFEAWVKPDSAGSGGAVIAKFNSGISGTYVFKVLSDGRIRSGRNTSPWGFATSESVLFDEYSHIATTYDGTTLRIYINGKDAGSLVIGSAPSTSLPVMIGAKQVSGSPGDFFDGVIDELRVWNVARTPTEIQDNMHNTLAGNETGLAAYYRFDHESGTALTDLTPNSYDGTLTNMTGNEWTVSDAFNTWTGATDTDWNTGSNWTNGVPVSTDNVGIPSGGNQPIISSAANCNHLVIKTGATLTISGTSTLTVSGNWINNGTFAAGTGTVILNGGNQSILGSNTFSNLTKNVATAATLTFQDGTTQAVTGTLDLQGASGNLLSLRSSSDGTQWQVNPSGTRTTAWLDVKDSVNTNATVINVAGTNTADSGNNSGWNFSIPVIAQASLVSQAMDEDGSPTAWTAPTVTASDGDGDTITWTVSTPATNGTATVSGTGGSPPTFTYVPDADYNGSDSFVVQAADPFGSDTVTVSVTVNAVNDTPSFVKGADQTVSEDPGAQTVSGWATSVSKGPANESGQTLTFNVSNDNNALFSSQPAVDASGNLTYMPAADANGSAIVTVSLSDNGGGADTSGNQTFVITVNAVNDTPSFVKGPDQTVNEDAGPQTATGWATSVSKGPADESGQTLTFNVSNDNNSLFSAQPDLDVSGNLTYTPVPDANGSATVTVSLSDNGSGADTSGNQTFAITVSAVNDTPSFIKGPDQNVNEDAGPQTVNGWATSISKGPANESGQILFFNVNNDNNALFSAQPAVDASGNLTYTPAADANGSATVTVSLSDNAGGADTSGNQTFMITVNAVNDTPSFIKGADQTVNEDAGPQSLNGWATSISKGPANESGQVLTFSVSNDNNALFSVQPAIDAYGSLTYTPAPEASGSATVTVSLSDSGGGADTSGNQTFTVTVNAVNDVPVITGQNSVSTPEETALAIGLHHVTVTDPDNSYPGDFSLTVLDGANYTRSGVTVTPVPNFNGTLTVPVKVSDGAAGSSLYNLSVTVGPVDDAPTVANAIQDVTANEDSADTVISLGSVFTDPDNDDSAIVKSVVSNTSPGLVTATVSGNTLTLGYHANQNGTALITLRGTSGGQFADDTLTVTVNPTDDAPTVANAIQDVTVNEDSANTAIDLGSVFTDIDNDNSGITKSVLFNSNPGLVSATVTANTLTLAYHADQNGTASVTIRGTSGGQFADDSFTITVDPADDAPTVASPIGDITAEEDGASITADLGALFTDTDNDDSAIAKSVLSNSNPTLVSVIITGNMLTLDFQENQNGTSVITVRGTSGGKTADNTFTVTVNASDDPPVIANPLPDVTVDEDSADTSADIRTLFTDIDNDDATIVKSVQSNSNESLVSATVAGNTLTLDYQTNQSGTAVITVLGTSNGQTVTDDFIVTVNDVNSYVSGKMTYYSNGNPVSGVALTMTGTGSSHTALSDENGRYIISSIPSDYDYVLTLSKEGDPGPGTLSSLDASRIARYVIGLYELTESEILAADVSGNGYVSGLDASRVARYKAGLITQMNDEGRHWAFSPVPEEYSPLDSDIENLDFTAMRLGDVSGTWQAESLQRSGRKDHTSEVSKTSEVSVVAYQGDELSVPVLLDQGMPAEGIDITAVFDEKVLDAAGVTLAGGILENKDYGLAANTSADARVTAAVFARSHLVTGAGTVAVLMFRVVGEEDDTTLLTFSEFACNRIPVSGPVSDRRSQTSDIMSGFYVNGKVSLRLKITVSGDQKITVEKDKNIMTYDLNRDGRVGLRDAVRALRQGDLEAAIQALQYVTGK